MTSVCFTPGVSEHLPYVPRERASQRHRTVQVSKLSPEDLQAFGFFFVVFVYLEVKLQLSPF